MWCLKPVAPFRRLLGSVSKQHTLLACRRSYHSPGFSNPLPFTPTETTILTSALAHVPAHGFTNQALQCGAQDAGFLPISTNLFPDGAFSIVKYHLLRQRLALAEVFQRPSLAAQPDGNPFDVLERVKSISLHRLLQNVPYIAHYQSALALLALPSHLTAGLHELALLSDEILYLAGSKNVTTAWYIDRAALASIYASAELYMTQDKSKDFVDTRRYLASRLQEGDRIRTTGSMVGQWLGMQLGGAIDGLRSKGLRI